MDEYVLYRWNTESMGPRYFVAFAEDWERYDRDHNERDVLARGAEDEMNRLLKLIKEE